MLAKSAIVLAILIIASGALYIRVRWWRSAPVSRAMIGLAISYLIAGSRLGAGALNAVESNLGAIATSSPTATQTPLRTPTRIAISRKIPVAGYATTWLGNTFRGGDYSPSGIHVQQSAMDMTVLPNGVSVLNTRWDEGHNYMGMYQNGQYIGQLSCPTINPTLDATGTSGAAITNNGKYIYATQNTGYANPNRFANYLGRWNLDGTTSHFSGAVGGGCTVTPPSPANLVVVDASPKGTKFLYGVAASATEVFVADPNTNSIKVYDANTMAYKRAFAFINPRRIAYDSNTTSLWISQGTSNQPNQLFLGSIYHYNVNGVQLSGTITSVARPTALLINPRNGLLYVTDDGPDQQIKEFNSSGVQTGTFGTRRGYLSGTPGVMSGTKVFRPNGLGFDNSANLYLLGGASSLDITPNGAGIAWFLDWSNDIREYASGGSLTYEMSAGGSFDDNSVADSTTDGQDFYSALNHYKFNYSNLTTGSTGGGTEWSWYSNTMDPFTYPHDPRQYLFFPNATVIRTIRGNKYLGVTDQYSNIFLLFHLVGEVAKPEAIFSSKWQGGLNWPNQSSSNFYWFDSNNNGEPDRGEFVSAPNGLALGGEKWWDLDTKGDVWTVNFGPSGYIGRWPMQGINRNGQLTYSTGAFVSYGKSSTFTNVQAMQYDAANDIMYVSGYTVALPPFGTENAAAEAGTVLARYNGFLAYWAAHGTWPTAAWATNLPHNQASAMWARTWKVAGSRIFAGLEQTLFTSSPKTVVHNIYVFDTATGTQLGEMQPGPETLQLMGWIDQNQGLSAYQRSDGEYVVTEEEQIGAKVTVLRGLLQNFTQY